MLSRPSGAVSPAWVPSAAKVYLAHTEQGTSIRALARAAGCHASTVLRQIRKVEQRRDDPLIDLALRRLGKQVASVPPKEPPASKETVRGTAMKHTPTLCPAAPDDALIEREARRILRRLAEPGACLAGCGDGKRCGGAGRHRWPDPAHRRGSDQSRRSYGAARLDRIRLRRARGTVSTDPGRTSGAETSSGRRRPRPRR